MYLRCLLVVKACCFLTTVIEFWFSLIVQVFRTELSLTAKTTNTCYSWAYLMLRVINVKTYWKGYAISFCEMLRVNLHLLVGYFRIQLTALFDGTLRRNPPWNWVLILIISEQKPCVPEFKQYHILFKIFQGL